MFWTCGHSKLIHQGDRFIFVKQGAPPRGVFGTGVAVSDWRAYEKGGSTQRGRTKNGVRVRIETFVNPAEDGLLTIASLSQKLRDELPWSTQSSGTLISDPEYAEQVRLAWYKWLGANPEESSESAFELSAFEGEATRRMIIHRKRERWLRDAKIASIKRPICEVPNCGFDFERIYGRSDAVTRRFIIENH